MSPKELLYIEDALGHEQIIGKQCESAAQSLQDGELKNLAQEMCAKHQQLFKEFYNLV